MGDAIRDEMRDKLGNLDQIRDLLFGDRIRDYENRFLRMESELGAVRQEMQTSIEQLKNQLSAELNVAVNSIEKKLKYLSATADEEIEDIRQQLERSTQISSTSIAAIDKNFKSQTNSLQERISQTRQILEQEIDAVKSELLKELDKRYTNLGEAKLSRDYLAELLFELCMRVKGTDLVVDAKEPSETKRNAELLLPERQG
ncbi:MAG: hypothetical protein Fur0025_02840 [Oscillatoriaceae cyanobacterium]